MFPEFAFNTIIYIAAGNTIMQPINKCVLAAYSGSLVVFSFICLIAVYPALYLVLTLYVSIVEFQTEK